MPVQNNETRPTAKATRWPRLPGGYMAAPCDRLVVRSRLRFEHGLLFVEHA
jgi:hypothetical protein